MVRPGPHCSVEKLDSNSANSIWSRNLARKTTEGFADNMVANHDHPFLLWLLVGNVGVG